MQTIVFRRSAVALLCNGLMFNLSWYLILTSGNVVVAWAVAAVHIGAHLIILGRGQREALLILCVAVCGVLLDQLLFVFGVLINDGGQSGAPLWLSALWPVFATTLLHAFSGLSSRLWLAGLVGAVGGYGSYRVGAVLSTVDIASPSAGVVIAILWGIVFPLGLVVAKRFSKPNAGNSA